MLFLSLSSALAFSPAARPALPTGRSAVRPTMLLQPADLDAANAYDYYSGDEAEEGA